MKKQIPIPVVVVIILAILGLTGFIYSRMPQPEPPIRPFVKPKLGINPHQEKERKLSAAGKNHGGNVAGAAKHPTQPINAAPSTPANSEGTPKLKEAASAGASMPASAH